MKIVCDSCAAQYTLSEEKVPQRVFKIRCKQCGGFIVVDPLSKQPEPLEDVDLLAAPASGTAAPAGMWYVVIGQDRLGPLPGVVVQEKVERGEVTASTLVWREGLPDWAEMGSVSDWKPVLAASKSPSKLRAQVEDTRKWLPQEPTTGLRNENSVLFSLGDLQKAAASPPPSAVAAATLAGKTESSGLVDIRALAAKTPVQPDRPSPAFLPTSPGSREDRAAPTAPASLLKMPAASNRKIPVWGWVVLGVLVAGCAVLAWWNISSRRSPETPPLVPAPVKTENKPVVQPVVPAAPAVKPTAPAEPQKPDPKPTQASSAAAAPTKVEPPAPAKPTTAARPPSSAPSSAPSKPTETPSSGSGEGGWGAILPAGSKGPDEILKKLESSVVADCKGSIKGTAAFTVSFTVSIAQNGTVQALATDRPSDEDAAVSCVRSRIKSTLSSGKWQGSTYSTKFSVTFSPG